MGASPVLPHGRPWTPGPWRQDGISFRIRPDARSGGREKKREEAMGACGKIAAACIRAVIPAIILGGLGALPPGPARAAELTVLTNQGATPGVREVAAAFAHASGHTVSVIQETGPSLEQRLKSNGPADLITSNPEQIGGLIKNGHVVAASVTPFVLASLGVSVRAGAPKPDISTVEAYKAALLAAKSIGYSRGCSGTNVAEGIEKLGLTAHLLTDTASTENGPV